MLEVEQKFRVDDLQAVAARLSELGAVEGDAVRQVDTYYAHPSRDFAATDEALRIRRVGDRSVITYKGPKLDATTKTRREIEVPLGSEASGSESWAGMLVALGFAVAGCVEKVRIPYALVVETLEVEIALDQVTGLGTYVEVEVLTDDESTLKAEAVVASVASELGLSWSGQRGLVALEPRSYIELLLLRD